MTILWDSGIPLESQLRPKESSPRRLLVLVEGEMGRQYSGPWVSIVRLLLDSFEGVVIDIGYYRSWDKGGIYALSTLAKSFPSRLFLTRNPSRQWRVQAYMRSHWLWYPKLIDNVGFYPLEALTLHCPVLAFDLPPINEFVRQNYNGHLLPCSGTYNWLGVPIGQDINSRQLLQVLEQVLADSRYESRLRGETWEELSRRKQNFDKQWSTLWGLQDNASLTK